MESIRALRTNRSGAVKTRTPAINQLKALLITAPASLREALDGRSTRRWSLPVPGCAPIRPPWPIRSRVQGRAGGGRPAHPAARGRDQPGRPAAGHPGRAAPRLLALLTIGNDHAGQLLTTAGQHPERLRGEAAFAHLGGVAPLPASSGKTHRHRLHRGGDRDANRALHLAVVVRMRFCPHPRAHVERRTKKGRSKPEIIRCIKRYPAREVYHALVADFKALHAT